MSGRERLGPTGQFPQGQLNETDEGGLIIAIGTERGHVRVDLGTPVAWFAMPPDLALQFAANIVKHAKSIKA
ncbi:MAG TPA: hypothetical protein VHT52_17475 [Stellaceae bacterium]|jgi:hypothetical protein|nr:hypothetical protein [Stellaceae bacterium]